MKLCLIKLGLHDFFCAVHVCSSKTTFSFHPENNTTRSKERARMASFCIYMFRLGQSPSEAEWMACIDGMAQTPIMMTRTIRMWIPGPTSPLLTRLAWWESWDTLNSVCEAARDSTMPWQMVSANPPAFVDCATCG